MAELRAKWRSARSDGLVADFDQFGADVLTHQASAVTPFRISVSLEEGRAWGTIMGKYDLRGIPKLTPSSILSEVLVRFAHESWFARLVGLKGKLLHALHVAKNGKLAIVKANGIRIDLHPALYSPGRLSSDSESSSGRSSPRVGLRPPSSCSSSGSSECSAGLG